jgi:putative transport protein
VEHSAGINWTIPISANLTLRQIGLVLFLAAVGTNAGYGFATTVRSNGLQMLAAGAAVTFAVTLVTLIIGFKVLKIPFESLMGLVAGVQTQPAVLAYAADATRSEAPDVAYAAVYPAAMIAKIILAQLLT